MDEVNVLGAVEGLLSGALNFLIRVQIIGIPLLIWILVAVVVLLVFGLVRRVVADS